MSCLVDVDGYYVQCSSNFMSYGANWTVSSTFFSDSGATFESCQQLCSDNSSCISFYHRSDTLECHLSTSSVRTSADCPSCSYNIKQCWQGTCTCISCAFPLTSSDFKINSSNFIHIFKQKLLWPRASIAHIHLVEFLGCSLISYSTTEFGYMTSSTRSNLTGQVMTYAQCEDKCTSDPLCYGFSHQADNQHCVLSDSGLHAWNPSCNTCSFSKKICLPGVYFFV